MASAEVPVVLRVKRKRTEDPADALGKLMLDKCVLTHWAALVQDSS